MAALDEETDRLVGLAWAPRTLLLYQVGIDSFKKFRAEYGTSGTDSPAAPLEVSRFIASLSLQGKAPTTIAAYTTAISNWHKAMRWNDPCNDFIVKKALKGGFRKASSTEIREPITIPLLQKLVSALQTICSSRYETSMFKCAYLMAFFGMFRIGELIASSKSKAGREVLRIEDLATKPGAVKISIRFSKTDQYGASCNLVLKGKKGSPLCPVEAIMAFIEIRGRKKGPFFQHFNGTFLSRYQFNKVLQMSLKKADPAVAGIKTHSFRIGGATNAMFKNIPYTKIQEMGRWKSDSAKRYIRSVEIEVSSLV